MLGYLVTRSRLLAMVNDQRDRLLISRRLPLVLDLDDTLVRIVSIETINNDPIYAKYPRRLRTLRDGRKVVLTDRVEEFLDWAKDLFEISVCSLGDQKYIEQIVEFLDPKRNRITGCLYSARQEYDFSRANAAPSDGIKPSKDLASLFSFCAFEPRLADVELGYGYHLPLIVDDSKLCWFPAQHDNIIEVESNIEADIWTVALFPVVKGVLGLVHKHFFQTLDSFQSGERKVPPSALSIYKDFLRKTLRERIAKTKVTRTMSFK